ncbi:hypothetical protein [Sphingobium aquiterrae]|uniref:hypothetical protein n=1 Tax=Sphingobium aquiterrae TaxID=2038656 RepID=UPI0030169510
MQDPTLYITMAATALAGIAILAFATLRGWNGWLDLKHAEMLRYGNHSDQGGTPSAAARIEVADLKERIRKLEAIAAGVDL